MRTGGSTKEPFKVLTSRRLPQLTLVTYYYYYTAWCHIKETILRLWLEQTERRTESEGKEWVLMFPGGVEAENERGEMEHAGAGSTPGLQPRSPLFKPLHNTDARTCARAPGSEHTLGHQYPSPTGKKGMLPEREVGGSYLGLCHLLKLYTTVSWTVVLYVLWLLCACLCKCVCGHIWVCLTGSPLEPAEPSLPCSPRGPGSPWKWKEQMYNAT